jgi:hypothetical protein
MYRVKFKNKTVYFPNLHDNYPDMWPTMLIAVPLLAKHAHKIKWEQVETPKSLPQKKSRSKIVQPERGQYRGWRRIVQKGNKLLAKLF